VEVTIVDKYHHLGGWLTEHVEWNTLTSQAIACGGLDMKLSKQGVVSCSYGGDGVQVYMCDFIACQYFMGMGGQVHSKASYVVDSWQ